MAGLSEIFLLHPAWAWAGAGAALLAVELATGSGWLLWPAASAGVVAVVDGFVSLSAPAAILLFVCLTIVTTVTARRYFPRRLAGHAEDINDNIARVVGHQGRAAAAFENGAGRVFVDGKEWAAELAQDGALEAGARVEVTAVSGARLKVRPI